jgi:hypothetical protein
MPKPVETHTAPAPTVKVGFLERFRRIVCGEKSGDEVVSAPLVAADLVPKIAAILAAVTMREGFPRGAAYTKHASADKHANASAAVEVTATGFDLILCNMTGARAEDAAGRLADHVAKSLYPSIKREGKEKADHRTKERGTLIKALGLAKVKDIGWTWAAPAWDTLRPEMPEARYAGSKLPANDREMIAFFVADEQGGATKSKIYASLLKNGGDGGVIQALYRRGFLYGTVKTDSVHEAYMSAKQLEARQKKAA